MPAARQRSSSPFMAFAVTATIGVRGSATALRLRGADLARQLVPVHARHMDVGEHRRVVPVRRRPGFERLDAVIDGVGIDAEQFELAHQHLAVHRMIVGNQDARPRRRAIGRQPLSPDARRCAASC